MEQAEQGVELERLNLEDHLKFPDSVLALFAPGIKDDPDVLKVFRLVSQFRETPGFKKAYLSDLESNRRSYDNAFMTLESQKLIRRKGKGSRDMTFHLTVRGEQMILYLVNTYSLPADLFRKVTDEEYQAILSQPTNDR